MLDYIANDDDLPPIFWPEGEAPTENVQRANQEMARFSGICLHYPAASQSQLEKQRARAEKKYEREIAREHRERQQEHTRTYIRKAKLKRMAAWIFAIAEQHNTPRKLRELGMDFYERTFFIQIFQRFRRWYPRVKNVTQKQYDFTEGIAMKYLQILPIGENADGEKREV